MKKITVIGCAGSGKTTFSKMLAERLHLPLYTIDELYYGPNWTKISQEELKDKLVQIMHEPEWVIDGQYTKLIPLRLEYVDTVIFFDLPKRVVMWRVIKRYIQQKREKEGVAGSNTPHFPWHQMKLILKYPRKEICHMLSDIPKEIKVVILRNQKEVDTFFENLQ